MKRFVWLSVRVCLVCACCLATFPAAAVAARAATAPSFTTSSTVTLLSDDFEGTFAWRSVGNPAWSITDYKCFGGTHSAHASSPVGGANAWMYRGPFDLSVATAATLDFELWYYAPHYTYPSTGTSGSFCVGYSTDGSTFYWPYQWSGTTNDAWAHRQFDMSSYLGRPQVWIAFMVYNAPSANAGYSEGAYVDNVSLTASVPDATPPTTTATGCDEVWHNTSVTVSLNASDNAGGSGLAATYYTLDGVQNTYSASFSVSARGSHTITYWSTDNAGNVEAAQSGHVKIDSQKPTTKAFAASVTKGKKVKLAYQVNDALPGCGQATVTLKIYKGKKLKKTIKVPGRCACNAKQSYTWRCKLAEGSYTVKVYATDIAGNAQSKVGSARLTVK